MNDLKDWINDYPNSYHLYEVYSIDLFSVTNLQPNWLKIAALSLHILLPYQIVLGYIYRQHWILCGFSSVRNLRKQVPKLATRSF